jgi:predicted DNA-binding protein
MKQHYFKQVTPEDYSSMVTARFPTELLKALDMLAELEGRTRAGQLRHLVRTRAIEIKQITKEHTANGR